MKIKVVSLFLAIACLLSFTACTKESQTEKSIIRVAGMTGPTMMGLAKLIDDSNNGLTVNDYEFSTFTSADMFVSDMVLGKYDIASIPAITATKLNIKTNGNIRIIAINTLGVLYVVSKGVEINSIGDLRGKTIYSTGSASMQEYTLAYLFNQSGFDANDVNIVWKSDNSEIIPVLKNSESCIAVLPEPFISKVLGTLSGVEVKLSLADEWQRLSEGNIMITSVIVTRKDFAEAHPDEIERFLDDAKASVSFANDNTDKTAELIGKYNIFDASAAKIALPNCNIVNITGEAMKTKVSAYIDALNSIDNELFGGITNEDMLFYER